MEITKLTPQAKNPDRVNIFIDGEFFRGIDRIIALKMGLKVGLTLNPYLVKQLDTQVASNDAWEYALKSLQYSSKSIRMMYRKLIEKFEPKTVHETMTRLIETKILDDHALAKNFVNKFMEQGLKSRRQIMVWLKTKLFDEVAIKESLELIDESYEKEVATKLAKKKFEKLDNDMDWFKKRDKINAHLAQRGFNYGTIQQVVTEDVLVQTQHLA